MKMKQKIRTDCYRAFLLFLAVILGACGEFYPQDSIAKAYSSVPNELQGSEDELGYPSKDKYAQMDENAFVFTSEDAISTFSIDADGASYANARSYLFHNKLPPATAVRSEEFLNYFSYAYPVPQDGSALALHTEVSVCPWDEAHWLLRIGLQGRHVAPADLPGSHFIVLIDISGSMSDKNKLPLAKEVLSEWVGQMRAIDRISLVTYASGVSVLLSGATVDEQPLILQTIESLDAAGSTAGEAAIDLAYEQAESHFIQGGNNRIILITDGDFNVGASDTDSLKKQIVAKRESGVYLTVLGFGRGNLNDEMLETLANNGNGSYEYVASVAEGRKVLIDEIGELHTVAKDVKSQVRFNPESIAQYRLIGYENRVLADEDFSNNATDAGEIGANQSITALYELIPVTETAPTAATAAEVAIRYEDILDREVYELDTNAMASNTSFEDASQEHQFATSVAGFALILRQSQHINGAEIDLIQRLSETAVTSQANRSRLEFVELVNRAAKLMK